MVRAGWELDWTEKADRYRARNLFSFGGYRAIELYSVEVDQYPIPVVAPRQPEPLWLRLSQSSTRVQTCDSERQNG